MADRTAREFLAQDMLDLSEVSDDECARAYAIIERHLDGERDVAVLDQELAAACPAFHRVLNQHFASESDPGTGPQLSVREWLEFGLSPPGYALDFSTLPEAEVHRAFRVITRGLQARRRCPGISLDAIDAKVKRECPRFHAAWDEQLEQGPESRGPAH